MPNPRGRPSNAVREQRAAEAAAQASQASREAEITPELPIETSNPPEKEEKSDIVLRPPRNDVRKQAMQEIEDRDILSKKGLGMELGLSEDETPKIKEKPEIPADLPPPTPESMLQGSKFSPGTVRVKVDGEEFDVSQQEIDEHGGVRAYQIQKAAENRLQKANEALAELRQLQAERKSEPKVTPDDFVKSKIEQLRWGTPEESAQALKEIVEKYQAKPIDQNMIIEAAADRIRHDEAVKAFDKEFTDIGQSNLHLKLVVALRNERLAKGHPGDWNSFYRSLGNEVRAVMPKQSQPKQAQAMSDTPSQASDKEERKSSIVNLPQAATRAALPEEPKTETRQDLLNSMRKARGLPIA
jgi:hypothetical protein